MVPFPCLPGSGGKFSDAWSLGEIGSPVVEKEMGGGPTGGSRIPAFLSSVHLC
jgi:hypothetical protein